MKSYSYKVLIILILFTTSGKATVNYISYRAGSDSNKVLAQTKLYKVVKMSEESTNSAGTVINRRKSILEIRNFIKLNWSNVIRKNTTDKDGLIGLPFPYTVPCVSGHFQEMYYWDTYFTNLGLIIDGNTEQAKNNCNNMLFLVDKYGFMLNGNKTYYLNRSQPPYLSMMIRDVFEKTKDVNWLKRCLPILEKEYQFWMSKRITPNGLNHYSNSANDEIKKQEFISFSKRLDTNFDSTILISDTEKVRKGSQFLSECESGWDFNPRFEGRCEDFCPVDLNSNLYMYENNFAFFYSQTKKDGVNKWVELAKKRKKLMNSYLYNSNEGLFYDYDYINKIQSKIYSAAVFNVLWSKIASKEQAKSIVTNLSKLEFKFGISTCEQGTRKYEYQWDYPNGWPNIQYLAVKGLENYGFNEQADRIAYKFIDTASMNFEKTKNLWEKYNITDGSIKVKNEYKMPAMMGWTAGVFVYLSDYLLSK